MDIECINAVLDELTELRGSGRGDLIFDGRDPGNYSGYSFQNQKEMMLRADPTGLCFGMIVNEMIEATINGSKVNLAKVLREPGFFEKVSHALTLKNRLMCEIEYPMTQFMNRVNLALSGTSESFGPATSREVAICLRDAIYSIEQGLKLRWLVCEGEKSPGSSLLCNTIGQFEDISFFTDELRHTLPFGAHLARIGKENTAIGIKLPGRIAFLSTLSINVHTGSMSQDAQNLMAESLDLDNPKQRYPDWVKYSTSEFNRGQLPVGLNTHHIDALEKLPRDRLIWLAMVIEIASQRMQEVDPSTAELAETISRALPASEAVEPGVELTVVQPNWLASDLAFEQAFDDLQVTPWERKIFELAVEGVSPSDFVPPKATLCDITKKKFDVTLAAPSFPDENWKNTHVRITPVQRNWVGTRSEIEKSRRSIFNANLLGYLLHWGNWQLLSYWMKNADSLKQSLSDNLDAAIRSQCVSVKAADFSCGLRGHKGIHLFSQSPKHKTYNPRCTFNPKKDVTHVLHIRAKNISEVLEVFDLDGKSDIPDFLQGWERELSWLTSNDFGSTASQNPVQTNERWMFSGASYGNSVPFFEASIAINQSSLDPDVRNRIGLHG